MFDRFKKLLSSDLEDTKSSEKPVSTRKDPVNFYQQVLEIMRSRKNPETFAEQSKKKPKLK